MARRLEISDELAGQVTARLAEWLTEQVDEAAAAVAYFEHRPHRDTAPALEQKRRDLAHLRVLQSLVSYHLATPTRTPTAPAKAEAAP